MRCGGLRGLNGLHGVQLAVSVARTACTECSCGQLSVWSGFAWGGWPGNNAGMGMIRRALAAIGLGAAVAAALRLRGSGGTPPQSGGWRKLSGPDQR